MSDATKLIPTGSQTVGPYFRIGLEHMIDAPSPEAAVEGVITVYGRVLDRDRAPVSDALLEFWSGPNAESGGLARAATDADGYFSVRINRPSSGVSREDLPLCLFVLVFARGLLRHLISRIYLGEETHHTDHVLEAVPADRRHTLIARREDTDRYQWNVILQGDDETVFFAW